MMPAHFLAVKVISRKGTKTVTLNCSGLTSVWELTQQLSDKLLDEKFDFKGAQGTICLRDQQGNRLAPNNKITTKKGSQLVAEIVKDTDGMQHDSAKRSHHEAQRKSITPKEDPVDVDSTTPSKRLRNATSQSPNKYKRKRTGEGDAERQPETPSSSSQSGQRNNGDADSTTTIKTKRKSRNRPGSENEPMICSDSEQEFGVCPGFETEADDTPTVRLKLKQRFKSDQLPSELNLRLRQRACGSCSDKEKSSPFEEARHKQNSRSDPVVDSKQTSTKRTAPLETKLEASEVKGSSSKWGIDPEDSTGKKDRTSSSTSPEAQTKSSKKANSAITPKKPHVDAIHKYSESSVTKEVSQTKERSVKTISREQPKDDRQKGGRDENSNKQGTKLLNAITINKVSTPESGRPKKAKKSTEKLADSSVVDLVCTDSGSSKSTTYKEADAKAIHKKSGTPGKSCNNQRSEPANHKTPAATNRAKSDGQKNINDQTKNKEFVELVDANCEFTINKKVSIAKNDKVVHKNSTETAEKRFEVKSKYFSTTSKGSGETANPESQHPQTSVDLKTSTCKVVGSSTPTNKTAVKSTREFVDAGGRNSETPVITVDTSNLATSCGISVSKHQIPMLSNEQRPKFIKIVVDPGRFYGANGLSNSDQGRGVNTPQDSSFTCIDEIDGDVYNDHDSAAPVEIADSQDSIKDDHPVSNEGEPVLINIGRNELKHSDLQTLEEGEWLNDCVINAYFCLLGEKSPLKIFTHSSFFFFSLYKRGYEGVQRWTKNVDLFAQDLVFIPIHNKSHWTLVVVHIQEGGIEYYNSSTLLPGYPRSMMHIRNYLKAEALHRGKTAFCETSWEMFIIDQIPRQQNMDDCGLFICQYAKKLSWKRKVNFDIETTSKLRQQMLRELVHVEIQDH